MRLILATTLLILFGVQLSSAQKPFIFASESLIPFEFQQEGEPAGINVEIIDLIMKKLNVPYEIRFSSNAGKRALQEAQEGTVDAILSVSYRPERTSYLAYPNGFDNDKTPQGFMWVSEYVFFTRATNFDRFQNKSLAELKAMNVKVGVIKGVSYDESFRNSGLVLVEADGDETNFKKLIEGDIDLYITDRIIGRYTSNKMGYSKSISALSGIILSKPYTIAMTTASKHPQKDLVKQKFYEELELLKRSGVARRLVTKYLNQ